MQVVDPDKVRFCDLDAIESDSLIHTVEVSDERSVRQFLTLWTKGKHPTLEITHHSPDVYHREKTTETFEPFISKLWPGKESESWGTHYHVDLDRPPEFRDFDRFIDSLPQQIVIGLKDYFLIGD